jgi:hypothetical protein
VDLGVWIFNQNMLYLLSAAWVAMGPFPASACRGERPAEGKSGLLEKKVGECGDEQPHPFLAKSLSEKG